MSRGKVELSGMLCMGGFLEQYSLNIIIFFRISESALFLWQMSILESLFSAILVLNLGVTSFGGDLRFSVEMLLLPLACETCACWVEAQ